MSFNSKLHPRAVDGKFISGGGFSKGHRETVARANADSPNIKYRPTKGKPIKAGQHTFYPVTAVHQQHRTPSGRKKTWSYLVAKDYGSHRGEFPRMPSGKPAGLNSTLMGGPRGKVSGRKVRK